MAHQQVAILVNTTPGGVLAPRARALVRGLAPEFPARVIWRSTPRFLAVATFLKELRKIRPDLLYLMDLGYPLVAASLLYRAASPCALVVETGDPLAEMLWSTGRVGRLGRLGVAKYEKAVLKIADRVVVRGAGLKEYLEHLAVPGIETVETIPDGVDLEHFHPMEIGSLRERLGIEGKISIGVMGTLNWSGRLRWGYGSELIEVLGLLRELPVCGLVLGDGPGRAFLERRAVEQGLSDRITFLGHIPHDSLPPYINAMDICLSTQTNDWVGRARTTAKLPLFLACGRFVLASRVGEAARVLPDEMLVDYRDGFDPGYSERLARRIQRVVNEPQLLRLGSRSRGIAESEFDYNILVPRLAGVLRSALNR